MDILTPKDHAEAIALFRSEIIGALSRRQLSRGQLRAALLDLSRLHFRPPGAETTRCFSVATLERWYYAYRAGGLGRLRPQPRSDRGRALALAADQRALVCDIRREHPSASAALILRTLVADGRLREGTLSPATLRRLFAQEGLDRIGLRDGVGQKTRLRWQADRPGALWHGDVCHGPALVLGGQARPLRVHGLLDDASRFVVALEAHHSEKEIDMLDLLVGALRRHGPPDALYLDNGSTYRGEALRLACERLGITLIHARPGDAPARGKMERFWRTLREGCLDFLGSVTSLHDVQVRLGAFLDQHYHVAPHASLMGQVPATVWGVARAAQRPDELTEAQLRDALTVRERRRVRRDTTVSADGKDWELDQGFLAGRVVTVARSLLGDTVPWVEHDGKRLALHLVDPIANSRRKRPRRRDDEPTPAPTIAFDPPTALLDRAVGRRPKTAGRR